MIQGDKFTRHFRSPINGSALRQEGCALFDQSGNKFPIFMGVPILIPDLPGLFSSHFQISTETGRALQASSDAPIIGYVMGCKLVIEEIGDSISADYPVGALFDFNGLPAFVTTDGPRLVNKLRIDMYGNAHYGWKTLQHKLKGVPPYLLLDQQFPNHRFSTYYELLLFIGDRSIEELQNGTLEHGHIRPVAEDNSHALTSSNSKYFKSMATELGLPIGEHPALEIGCGSGFLTRAIRTAGANEVVGTDLRLSGFGFETWAEPDATPGLADMFQWSYPADYFSIIAVRNNSAFAFASKLDRSFATFIDNCLRSIRENGAIYLTFLTNGSGIPGDAGFANHTVREIVDWLISRGVTILKLMQLGSMLGFWLGKDSSRLDSIRQHVGNNRLGAFKRYLSSPKGQRDQTLAVADFACEIALRCHIEKRSTVFLWGSGILAYQTWRMLNILHPDITVKHVVRRDKHGPSVFNLLHASQAPKGEIHALVDDSYYDAKHAGIRERWMQKRFLKAFPKGMLFTNPTSIPSPGPYHFLSGDHDDAIAADLAKVYFRGKLRSIDTQADMEKEDEFENSMRYRFPTGFTGV